MLLLYVFLIAVALAGAAYIYMLHVKDKIMKKRRALSETIKESIEDDTYNEKNEEGYTPLMLSILGHFNKSFDKLLEAGADVNIKGNLGEQALHLAAHHSDEQVIEKLLDAGAEVNTEDAQGCTPIWYAAQNNKHKNLEILIEAGAELDHKDKEYGLTPLMIAAQNGNYKCVDLLLDAGADKTVSSEKYGTAYDIAKNRLQGNIKQNKNAKEALEAMVEKLKI